MAVPRVVGMVNKPPASHAAKTKSAVTMHYLNPHSSETSLNPGVSNAGQESSSGRIARTQPLLSGYFGPTSFVSPLTGDVDLGSEDQGLGLEIESAQRVLPPYWVHKISEIILTLNDFATAEALIRDYYTQSQSAIIAAPFVLNSLAPVGSMCKESISDRNLADFTSSLTVNIIQNTSETFKVPSATRGRDFHTLFTGPAIRLEIIGLLCALAGRARYLGLASDRCDEDRTSRSQYAHKMFAASEAALHICKILTPLNDLTIWLVHEILLLSYVVHGDSSPACWKRLGELSTDIFALGLHRDSKASSDVPEFLLESRRRQFAAAYQLDKSIATFLGRPPRIPWRYADCRMPLDISDEALATDNIVLNYSHDYLDENGWNTHGVVQRSSWIRVRFIISTFRDEILEVSLQNVTPEMENMLKNISQRCHLAWDSLPNWLRYSPQCWDQNLHIAVCLMMNISYLAYLYNDFLIQRLIAGKNNPRGNTALLSVSVDILSTVLKLGTQREQTVDLRPEFAWTVLLYGFPSASLLIKALQHQKRTGEAFLYEGSRSALIRNLSVFISHLESIVRPDNANYALFQRASQLFSRIIDEILEPHSILPDSNLADTSAFDFDPMMEVDGLDLFNNMDFGVAFNQWLL
ncbi:Transcription factor, fungi [Penicillium expansum]|uniref:Transcription factor, fungi n=1 Tax=Penicillium expansum TaxID=27334 RepID=A0A0A2I436_PENEN|nr:Transcription factor, fungi [Penicillium expansum]KGO37198.1 Transcription factor, fungi [Penicillium expansum]KGO61506.1 Transcription factor, fungi [Penicillium expansum]KGO62313.1 Transcription factor, fungi [Penicillium expansum]